jgi:transcription antitermination factor NusA-like protein
MISGSLSVKRLTTQAMQIINPTQAAAGAICSDNGERVSNVSNVLNNDGIEIFLTLILLYGIWT